MTPFRVWLRNLALAAAGRGLILLVIALAGMGAIRLSVKLIRRTLEATPLEKGAHTLILSLSRVVLWLLLGLSLVSALGIDVTGIVALASVLTLAVSLALQNMLGNVLGGFTLLSTHPFHTGDYVEIAGQAGTVEEINMTYTRLATPDNKQVSIPNSAVVAAQITNHTAAGKRRADAIVYVSYDEDPRQVIDALLQAVHPENALKTPAPSAVLLRYGESAIEYALRFWVDSDNYWDALYETNRHIHRVFQERNIHLACPKMRVEMKKE